MLAVFPRMRLLLPPHFFSNLLFPLPSDCFLPNLLVELPKTILLSAQ